MSLPYHKFTQNSQVICCSSPTSLSLMYRVLNSLSLLSSLYIPDTNSFWFYSSSFIVLISLKLLFPCSVHSNFSIHPSRLWGDGPKFSTLCFKDISVYLYTLPNFCKTSFVILIFLQICLTVFVTKVQMIFTLQYVSLDWLSLLSTMHSVFLQLMSFFFCLLTRVNEKVVFICIIK